MHVGVCAVVVGKDKAARVGREKKSPLEAYQSVLNCFIITEMHRHNFLLKIMQSFISIPSLNMAVCVCVCLGGGTLFHFLSPPNALNLTSSCISRCGAMLSTV